MQWTKDMLSTLRPAWTWTDVILAPAGINLLKALPPEPPYGP